MGDKGLKKQNIISHKFNRLLVPFFLYSVIYILWMMVKMIVFKTPFNYTDAIISTITTYGYAHFWFLPTMFYAYFLTLFLRKENNKIYFGIYFILLSLFLLLANTDIFSGGIFAKKMINFIARILLSTLFMLLGAKCQKYLSLACNEKDTSKTSLISILCFITTLLLFRFNSRNNIEMISSTIGNPIIYFITAIAGSIGVILFARNKLVINIFECIGLNSLTIYGIHNIVIDISYMFLSKIPISFSSELTLSVAAIVGELLILNFIVGIKNHSKEKYGLLRNVQSVKGFF